MCQLLATGNRPWTEANYDNGDMMGLGFTVTRQKTFKFEVLTAADLDPKPKP